VSLILRCVRLVANFKKRRVGLFAAPGQRDKTFNGYYRTNNTITEH
jgi:hypothetical protein